MARASCILDMWLSMRSMNEASAERFFSPSLSTVDWKTVRVDSIWVLISESDFVTQAAAFLFAEYF